MPNASGSQSSEEILDSVRWISKTDELSPYDVMSVDEDDQLMYIEVKSTKGLDPADPFYISHGELIEAAYRRSRTTSTV